MRRRNFAPQIDGLEDRIVLSKAAVVPAAVLNFRWSDLHFSLNNNYQDTYPVSSSAPTLLAIEQGRPLTSKPLVKKLKLNGPIILIQVPIYGAQPSAIVQLPKGSVVEVQITKKQLGLYNKFVAVVKLAKLKLPPLPTFLARVPT